MEKEDTLDALISKFSKKIKKEVIPLKTSCPDEEVLWKYIHGGLKEKEKEGLDRHLLSCSECFDILETLRMIETAEQSLLDLHEALKEKTIKTVRQELQKKDCISPAPFRIVILWDRMHNRITQLSSKLDDLVPGPMLELQAVREIRKHKKGVSDFPLIINIIGNIGEISFGD